MITIIEHIALISIFLGRNSFHNHYHDRHGKAVNRTKFTQPKLIEPLTTSPVTMIAIEDCGDYQFIARRIKKRQFICT